MRVFIVSHDQGVDGGRAEAVFATVERAIAYVEQQKAERYPRLKRLGELTLVWESLGDTFYIDEFEVG